MSHEDLKQEIENYNSLHREYHSTKDTLFDRIKELFSPEFDRIKSKLPEGYELSEFCVGDDFGGVGVAIYNPQRGEEIVDENELDMLRELLRPEFDRVKGEYGFSVELRYLVEM